MIRIIYEWQVKSENIQDFKETWKESTSYIHDTVKGARGSFLLQEKDNPNKILTIARWDSEEDWQTFFNGENPQQMQKMRSLGERISVNVFDEYDDVTV